MSRRRKPQHRSPDPQPGKFAFRRFMATCTPEEERELLVEIAFLAIEMHFRPPKERTPR